MVQVLRTAKILGTAHLNLNNNSYMTSHFQTFHMIQIGIKLITQSKCKFYMYTVKPVYKGHSREPENVPIMRHMSHFKILNKS
jgi:hypothetical protein